jgi:hypothetical protein
MRNGRNFRRGILMYCISWSNLFAFLTSSADDCKNNRKARNENLCLTDFGLDKSITR